MDTCGNASSKGEGGARRPGPDAYHTNPEEVLFLSNKGHPTFEPDSTNLNYPEWKTRTFSMTDPDTDRHNAVACMLERKQWGPITRRGARDGNGPVPGPPRTRWCRHPHCRR